MTENNKTQKLKRKEDILAEQKKATTTPIKKDPSGGDNEVKKSKDEAEIAEHNKQKKKIDIETKLLEQGYESLQQAQDNIKELLEDAQGRMDSAVRIEREAQDKLIEVENHEAKLQDKEVELSEREQIAQDKVDRATEILNNSKGIENRCQIMKTELENIIDYHNQHIFPCVKALENISKGIYNWMDLLNENTKYDFSKLYNYVCDMTKRLDDYVDTIPKEIDKGIVKTTGVKDE